MWLDDERRYRNLMETGISSVLASARFPASTKFDLAGPRCVNEYEYCHRWAGLDQFSPEERPQDVSLALMILTKPALRVDANGLAREGTRTSDRDFEVPLEWNATTRNTHHLAELMVGRNHPEAQVNLIRRDRLRRVYVGLPLFWEDREVPFALRAKAPPVCAYLGFRMVFEVPDDPRWWITLSECVCVSRLSISRFLSANGCTGFPGVPSSVHRAWRVMGLEGILEGVEEGVADKLIRLVGCIERIKCVCMNSEYRQPLDVPQTFTTVFDNGDFVVFGVAEWVPLLGEDGMVETEPQDDESRLALRIDRGARVYGSTPGLPRRGYPDGLQSHDLNQPRADKYGLSKKQRRTAERALRRSIWGAGLHGTFRSLDLA